MTTQLKINTVLSDKGYSKTLLQGNTLVHATKLKEGGLGVEIYHITEGSEERINILAVWLALGKVDINALRSEDGVEAFMRRVLEDDLSQR